jgi:hypothetical protein
MTEQQETSYLSQEASEKLFLIVYVLERQVHSINGHVFVLYNLLAQVSVLPVLVKKAMSMHIVASGGMKQR